jgi:hypothetical protein
MVPCLYGRGIPPMYILRWKGRPWPPQTDRTSRVAPRPGLAASASATAAALHHSVYGEGRLHTVDLRRRNVQACRMLRIVSLRRGAPGPAGPRRARTCRTWLLHAFAPRLPETFRPAPGLTGAGRCVAGRRNPAVCPPGVGEDRSGNPVASPGVLLHLSLESLPVLGRSRPAPVPRFRRPRVPGDACRSPIRSPA